MEIEERIKLLEKKTDAILERNSRVEGDKAWETSLFRMVTLALITYVAAAILLYQIDAENYFLSALVPAASFILSVQSLPIIKRWWLGRLEE